MSFMNFLRSLLLLLIGLLGVLAAQAQPTRTWERTYLRADGGYLTTLPLRPGVHLHVGSLLDLNAGEAEMRLVLTRAATGDTLRVVRLNRNGPGGYDFPSDAVLEPDGAATVFGYHAEAAASAPGTFDYTQFAVQLDTLGRVRWQRFLNLNDFSTTGRLLRLPDGYLLTTNAAAVPGQPEFPVARLTKLDRQGNTVWQRRYPSAGFAGIGGFYALALHPDGSILAAGFRDVVNPATTPFWRRSHWLVKLRPTGDTIRSVTVGTFTEREEAYHLALTPDGGVALAGLQTSHRNGDYPDDGQLVKLDAQLQPEWTRTIIGADPTKQHDLRALRVTAAGDLVLAGRYRQPGRWNGYLSAFSAAGAPRWSLLRQLGARDALYETLHLEADGSAVLAGSVEPVVNTYAGLFTRYAGVGAPYVPNLCAVPPTAQFAWARPQPDSLVVLDTSLPGPQYAEAAVWRWDFGDGTPAVEGQARARHRYAQVPPAGTPVRLTVTNNLGCTSTVTLYPFGQPTATRASAALAASVRLYPNPAPGGRATLDAEAPTGGATVATVAVTDALGRAVSTHTVRAAGGRWRCTVDLAGRPAGVYLVRLTTLQGTAVRRLVRP
ncbi:T9SS type A sorting domain-containing protein [Hymenobacter koreensis]|uniref:PKD domain-containing protein n=1 Tax=Hymenobacter koreensis TaxID=1084523 RepID=A0ABP8JMX9_9BACT